ncbi:MAG: rRNA maturation RNase YbeY [Candidatus Omnitrophica bacterium]|nr:rRNA maturation RNase YbeY [Candidatus Omnitrophota bacterium]
MNRQSRHRVPVEWLRRVVKGAVRELKVREAGIFSIAFVDERTMRRLNRRFMRHEGLTDVLSFRYDTTRCSVETLRAAGGESCGEQHVETSSGHGARGSPRRARSFVERGAPRRGAQAVRRTACEPGPAAPRDQAGPQTVIGEIVVSPDFAREYAKAHGLSYREELARYVIHGLLHWVGHDDRTASQQRRMRRMEDELLAKCAHRATR